MYQTRSRVLEHEKVAEGYFRLSFESPEVAKNAVPGQFVMVKAGGTNDPLLRRPFSIHRIKSDGIEILYKVIGKGTGIMAHIKTREEVDIIGPLGRGFNLNVNFQKAVIVGGGIGIAPLVGLAERLADKGKNITVFIGGRSKKDILCVDDFRKIGADVHVATDDGSAGRKGFVTDYFLDVEPFLTSIAFAKHTNTGLDMLFVCGPHIMAKKICEAAIANLVPCQVSLEAHMACGVGACLGCVIKIRSSEFGVRSYPIPSPTLPLKGREFSPLHQGEGQGEGGVSSAIRNPQFAIACGCDSEQVPCDTQLAETSYKRVCMEGPVFDAEEVVWE